MTFISWDQCTRNIKFGGLGLRHTESHIKASLLHLAWRFLHYPHQLWATCLAHNYLRPVTFQLCSPKPTDSTFWKLLLTYSNDIRGHLSWVVGDRSQIEVFQDKWIPNFHLSQLITVNNHPPLKVADLIENSDVEPRWH